MNGGLAPSAPRERGGRGQDSFTYKICQLHYHTGRGLLLGAHGHGDHFGRISDANGLNMHGGGTFFSCKTLGHYSY